MRLAQLYRYPVKGLSPEALETAELPTDGYFPFDRLFALENGPSGFDPSAPEHQPKIKFLMLMKNGALAGLATRYDEDRRVLSISQNGREVARGDLRTAEGRAAIEGCLADYLGAEAIRGRVRLLEAPAGFRFTDFEIRLRLSHQSRERRRHRGGAGREGRSAALSRQSLYRGRRALDRGGLAGAPAADRRDDPDRAEDDRPLRRHRGRARHWPPRHGPRADHSQGFRPHRLRRLRPDRAGRAHFAGDVVTPL